MSALWAAWASSVACLAVAAYFYGRWRGRIGYIDEVWEIATMLGAHGQVVRDEARLLGLTVEQYLELEDWADAGGDEVDVRDVQVEGRD